MNNRNQSNKQDLLSHLIDLRKCLIKILAGPTCLIIIALPFANKLYSKLSAPILGQLPQNSNMIATDIATPLLTPFKFAIIISIFTSMPWILYCLWQFIAPALYKHEKKLAKPILISSICLFYLGILFAYTVVFPIIFKFFALISPENIVWMPDINSYLNFCLGLFFAFGCAFELPIVVVILLAMNVVSLANIKNKRSYIIVIILIIAMLLTPPDIISQLLLAIPMWLLFELGILFAYWLKIGSK